MIGRGAGWEPAFRHLSRQGAGERMIDARRSFVFAVRGLSVSAALVLLSLSSFPQKLALITPDKESHSISFAEHLEIALAGKVKLADRSMGEAAFNSVSVEDPFNLTLAEAKHIGSVLGCDFFIFVRSANQRRSSLEREEYYESYAVIYLVSSRTGRLVFWKLVKGEAATPPEADRLLFASADDLAKEISGRLKTVAKEEIAEKPLLPLEEMPAQASTADKSFRGPVPYLRIKPEYTRLAYLYDVKATVDISVDLDRDGKVIRTEIVRWAGFGLDESVEDAVRKMNWRPAERNGKTLPMRVLLRYNFKKIEKD